MKNKTLILITVLLIICSLSLFTGCSKKVYGMSYNSLDELKFALVNDGVNLNFPELKFADGKDNTFNYISNYSNEQKKNFGYKLYCFSDIFNVAVYGYNYTSDTVICDDPNRLITVVDNPFANNSINFCYGKGFQDSLFLIATLNYGGNHYEIRVVGNKDTDDKGKFIHQIFFDNEYYTNALVIVGDIAASLTK